MSTEFTQPGDGPQALMYPEGPLVQDLEVVQGSPQFTHNAATDCPGHVFTDHELPLQENVCNDPEAADNRACAIALLVELAHT